HFDFYRFNFPEEFVDAGFGEYFRDNAICLVEWPDKAAGYVPPADLALVWRFAGEGRQLAMVAHSPDGQQCLNDFVTRWPVAAG
ncbi:MAG: tRNA (adenosine(37)-N6)-threonylcarbamoyltransferase complex ATPase subunit type 1 TsaE, partial [Candidatus Accumulibacter sp.]|nr:tRNA (adenosine(37)-N6)-threonylcarbamoyltransferase complex ATPase subunit type 1 TsaE [Accumulibacter sp.]